MKNSWHYSLLIAGGVGLLLAMTGCQTQAISSAPMTPSTSAHTPSTLPNITQQTLAKQSLAQQAQRIQTVLANGDYDHIITDIHPIRGVRFSMYAYVRPEVDKVFSREQFAQYLRESRIRFTWGDLDGTGDLLIQPLPEYLNTWVAADTFKGTTPSINVFKHNGNMINNLKEIYPNSEVVEYYFAGTEQYSGMDWRIMRLVFEEYQGQRYLVAIVNEQWTV